MATTPFWRAEPLTEAENALWQALMQAHHNSVFRPNASTNVVQVAAAGSGDLSKALSAAISTIGGLHAPLYQTALFLLQEKPEEMVEKILAAEAKVPGWGNSFVRGEKDPLWAEVEQVLAVVSPSLVEKLEKVTEALHKHGKKLYPNPSAYSAAAGIALGLRPALLPFVFISGRLAGWTVQAANSL
jgi:citrate synthase